MNILNPTVTDLVLIAAAQKRQWASLNAKGQWTEEDFEEALHCHNTWIPEQKDWFITVPDIEKLAFDPRTPQDHAIKLQQMLVHTQQQLNQQGI